MQQLCQNVKHDFLDPSTHVVHPCAYVCYPNKPLSSPRDCQERCPEYYNCTLRVYNSRRSTTTISAPVSSMQPALQRTHSVPNGTLALSIAGSAVFFILIAITISSFILIRQKKKNSQNTSDSVTYSHVQTGTPTVSASTRILDKDFSDDDNDVRRQSPSMVTSVDMSTQTLDWRGSGPVSLQGPLAPSIQSNTESSYPRNPARERPNHSPLPRSPLRAPIVESVLDPELHLFSGQEPVHLETSFGNLESSPSSCFQTSDELISPSENNLRGLINVGSVSKMSVSSSSECLGYKERGLSVPVQETSPQESSVYVYNTSRTSHPQTEENMTRPKQHLWPVVQ